MKRLLLALAAVLLLTLGALGDRMLGPNSNHGTAAAAQTTAPLTTANTSTSSLDQATEHAYAIASPSIVYIVSQGLGSGSGVIYNSNGDIVTNDHVINGATHIKVTLKNGRTYPAHVVGTDPVDDLAVIHINAPGLVPAHFAAAGAYQVAEMVLAIGNPLGLNESVSVGLISGLQRVEQEPNGAYLPNAIQTSAPINPGNSGGALVALDGTVVGIPTLEQTGSQSGGSVQSIGFAIPSNRVVFIANQIVTSGKVTHTGRAYMGIAPTDAATAEASPFGLGGFSPNRATPTVAGALVARLAANGPAAKAGIRQGDVITAVDGASISDAQSLLTVLAQKKPGQTITVKINRNGRTHTTHVRLGELPA